MRKSFFIKKVEHLERVEDAILHLSANENILSRTAKRMVASPLSERYFFGGGHDRVLHIGNAAFFGLTEVVEIETYAKKLLEKKMRGQEANFNCLSGLHAMMCVLLSSTKPGDTIMTIRERDGGHFATCGIIKAIGRKRVYAPFNRKKMEFDYDAAAQLFKKTHARILYLDNSNQLKPIDIKRMRRALGKKAIIVYDASHTLGLMLDGVFPNPLLLGADAVTANTHKTFPGPQKALIIFKRKNFGKRINVLINSSLVSSVHTHHLLALCVAVAEMVTFGKKYAEQTVKNANVFAAAIEKLGYAVRRADADRYTYNHQVHVFLSKNAHAGIHFKRLVQNNISLNLEKNILGKRYFMRIGTQEVTRLGMKEKEMKTIARIIHGALSGKNMKKEVALLKKNFKNVDFSFD